MVKNKVSINVLTHKYTSKADLYRMLTVECKYASISFIILIPFTGNSFLPSARNYSLESLLNIMNKKKKAFRKDEVAQISVRNFKELRVKNLLNLVLPHTVLESYLPDKKRVGFKVDETFVVTIIAKV